MFYYSKRERLVCEGHRKKIYKQYKYKGVLTVCGMDWFIKGDSVLLQIPHVVFSLETAVDTKQAHILGIAALLTSTEQWIQRE